ncbi:MULTISPECIES: MDR family MFS transporter [Paenibacillus]|uniref:MDR family MFS transporter n=1 Tax=Paenibacillus TaxID=44249 RepID=UPI00073F4C84|nr:MULTISPECIES: MFS transporter [Paenibacillus]MDU4698529.1 MFS transporter [Paenibacillus sp.]
MQLRIWDANLKIRLVGEALFNLLFWMYFPFIAVYFGTALGNRTAGLLMALPPLFSMVGNLVGGALADRIGRRPVMLAGALIQALMFVLFAVSSSHLIEYLAYIGIGLGGAAYRPASSAMVADLVPAEHRRQVFATFTTANNLGAVLGPALGAVFFFRYRQELLWTCAGILLLYFIAIYFVIRETKPFAALGEEPAKPVSLPRFFHEQWKGYGVILRDRVFFVYLLAGVFALVPIMQLDLYLAVYLSNEVPAQALFQWGRGALTLSGKEVYGWILGFNGLLFVLFVLPITKWLRHWKERDIFVMSALLSGGGTFAVGLNPQLWYLFAVTILYTLGEMIRMPVTQSFISRYAPEQARGQYMGADNLQYTFGRMLAPITVTLSAWLPPMGVFTVILVFAFVSVGFYLQLYRMAPEPETPSSENS